MYLADRVAFHTAAMTLSLYEVLPLEGKKTPDPDVVGYVGNLVRYVDSHFERLS